MSDSYEVTHTQLLAALDALGVLVRSGMANKAGPGHVPYLLGLLTAEVDKRAVYDAGTSMDMDAAEARFKEYMNGYAESAAVDVKDGLQAFGATWSSMVSIRFKRLGYELKHWLGASPIARGARHAVAAADLFHGMVFVSRMNDSDPGGPGVVTEEDGNRIIQNLADEVRATRVAMGDTFRSLEQMGWRR